MYAVIAQENYLDNVFEKGSMPDGKFYNMRLNEEKVTCLDFVFRAILLLERNVNLLKTFKHVSFYSFY